MYKVNLIPRELQSKPFYQNRKMLRSAFVSLMVGIILVGYGAFLFNVHLQKEKLKSLELELMLLTPSAEKLDTARNTKTVNHQKIIKLQSLLKNNVHWFNLLQDVNNSVPKDTWLTKIQLVREKYEVSKEDRGQGFSIDEMVGYGSKPKNSENVPSNSYKRVLTITGGSKSLSAVGVFTYNLQQLSYFQEVNLEKAWDMETEPSEMMFSINAVLPEGDDIE
ncbi:MAG: hypothetical protein FH758_09820 [Firmicutes bacterium]|nr:hypothetical protein [Bacillota bacterium]